MLQKFQEINWQPDNAEKRKFGLTLAIGFPFAAIAWFLIVRLFSGSWNLAVLFWIAGIGYPLGLLLAALPVIAGPFYTVWFSLVCIIDIVIVTVLFSVLYYLIITPIGLLMRLFGREPIRKGFNRDAKTYWTEAEKVEDPRRYYRQF